MGGAEARKELTFQRVNRDSFKDSCRDSVQFLFMSLFRDSQPVLSFLSSEDHFLRIDSFPGNSFGNLLGIRWEFVGNSFEIPSKDSLRILRGEEGRKGRRRSGEFTFRFVF